MKWFKILVDVWGYLVPAIEIVCVCESNPVPKGCSFFAFCVFVRFSQSNHQNRGTA